MILRVETTITLQVNGQHFIKKHTAIENDLPTLMPDHVADVFKGLNKLSADAAWDSIAEDLENFSN